MTPRAGARPEGAHKFDSHQQTRINNTRTAAASWNDGILWKSSN